MSHNIPIDKIKSIIDKIEENTPSYKFETIDKEKIIFRDSRGSLLYVYYGIDENGNYYEINNQSVIKPISLADINDR